ncbi:MAG TPA: geranylgeranyl reductase family protein [Nitrospiria bacterium]|nr:geranylgeranyl reductase family protein [Nitrospiria bacterium]
MTLYDAIIVGMGPGGSTTARLLAEEGHRVLGLDKAEFPRYKPCGGGLSARTLPHLPEAIRPQIEATIHNLRFTYRGTRMMNHRSPKPVAYMVRRPSFDQALAGAAEQAGATVQYGLEVRRVTETASQVEVEMGNGVRHRAKFVIGADGAQSRIGRLIDPRPAARPAWSLEAEAPRPSAGSTAEDEVWLDLGTVPGGYGWSFPKAGHLSIGVAGFSPVPTNPRATLAAYLKAQRPIEPDSALTLHSHPIPAVSTSLRRLASDRLLVVGDAANLVDPFFGEGIYYAIYSGEIAAQCVAAALGGPTESVDGYTNRIKSLFEEEFRLATKLATIAYRLPFLWYLAMRAWPEMTEEFYLVLRSERTYRQIIDKLRAEGGRYLAQSLRRRVRQLMA